MADQKSTSKYQVYFFLYLAVICELLIIIVERDDAEEVARARERQLLKMVSRVVTEMTNTMPIAVTQGTNQMKVGERRRFEFVIQGVGPSDEITTAPRIEITRNGAPVGTLVSNTDILLNEETLNRDVEHGVRRYYFDWTAGSVGRYEFIGSAGTGRITVIGDSLKMGNLMFRLDEIRRIYPDIDRYIDAGLINSSMFVDVIAPPDAMRIYGQDVVTAVGFGTSSTIQVQGVDGAKVGMMTTEGSVRRDGAQHLWTGSAQQPGITIIHVSGNANRGGEGSFAETTFKVDARVPVPAQPLPQDAFVKETFSMNIQVAGLVDVSKYRWTVLENGTPAAEGTGTRVEYKPKGSGRIVIKATYDGREYPVEGHGTSTFSYNLKPLHAKVLRTTFAKNGEYPINHRFAFQLARYGRHRQEVCEPVPENQIDVEVVDANGRDLLDKVEATPTGQFTQAYFTLKGKVPRDGIDATIRVSVRGELSETIPIRLYTD